MHLRRTSLRALAALLALSSLAFLSGCQTGGARVIDSSGPETITSLDQIDIQDWESAASDMVDSLLVSGVLERAPTTPAVLVISRIVNNTQQQVDTDSLVKKIRVALNQTGKVATATTIGLDGRVEDPLARDSAAMQQFIEGEEGPRLPQPHFSLSGKLLENRTRAGSTRQVTYTFQLSLTEIASGLAVWEDERQITKQGKRPSVGW
ncbi:MAG: penicillin-binding protein activator LpoB [Opitutales bacterium]